ncbi:MAG: hypothetical protein L6R43_08160 [Planctomycetes bacterium]|nr:hypothetical protein [Planctomycetota bacterium]
MRSAGAAILAAAFAAIPAAAALAGVDAEVPAALKAKGTLAREGEADVFRFEAAAGTVLSLSIAAQGKAPLAFEPRLVGPGEAPLSLDGAEAKPGKFRLPSLLLPAAGGYRLEVAAEGTGDYALSLKAKVKGLKTLKLEARSSALGRPGGGETLLRRILGPAGGVLAVEDPEADLDGALLEVPAGAVPAGTAVELRSAPLPALEPLDRQAAGPGAAVGPPDLGFALEATLSLPFEEALLPADASPGEVEFCLEPPGEAPALAAPADLDAGAGLVAVTVPGALAAAPVVRHGLPRLEASYWLLNWYYELGEEPPGDSRNRNVMVGIGTVDVGEGTLDVALEERWIQWNNLDILGGGGVFLGLDAGLASGTRASGGTVPWHRAGNGDLVVDEEESPVFRSSRDGTVLVGRNGGLGNSCSLDLLVRRMEGPFTVADLAGAWQWAGLRSAASASGAPYAPAGLETWRAAGTLVLGADGRVVLSGTECDGEADGDHPEGRETVGSFRFAGTAAVEPGGTVLLDFGPGGEGPPPLRARPGRNGDVMLLAPAAFDGEEVVGILALRQASRFRAADLVGSFRGANLWVDPSTYPVRDRTVPDFGTGSEEILATVTAGGKVMEVATSGRAVRRPGDSGALRIEATEGAFDLPLSASKKGTLALADPEGGRLTGAATDDGEVFLLARDPARKGGDYFLAVFVREP